MRKFTRPRDDEFYEKLTYIEKSRPEFPGMELEHVELRAGTIEPYVPPEERLEAIKLRGTPGRELHKEGSEAPDWAAGGVRLGEPAGRVRQMDETPREPSVPARDQVKLKVAKPKPATEKPPEEHVTIEEERARLGAVK